MGQKVNPIGLRLGVHRKWNSSWSFDFNNYSKFIYINFDIEKFFEGFLYYYPKKIWLTKCQILKLPSNRLYIFVFFYKLRFRKIDKLKSKKRLQNKNNLNSKLNQLSLNNNYNLHINKNYLDSNLQFNNLISIDNTNFKNFDNHFIQNYKKVTIKNLINLSNNLNQLLLLKNKKKLPYLFWFKNYRNIRLQKIILVNNLTWIKNYYNLVILNNKLNILNNQENSIQPSIINSIKYKIHILLKKNKKIIFYNSKYKILLHYNFLISLLKNKNTVINNKYYLKLLLSKFPYKKSENNFKKYLNNKKYSLNNKLQNKLKLKNHYFYIKLKNIKRFISKFTNSKVSIIFINSLSFSRFYYYLDHKNEKLKRNLKTIQNIERQMVNRYRYDTIYISDLINITFISMLFKNPQFLVKFIAFQFKKLPKNKKQMKLIQLITQVIQTFTAERDEIIGLKLQFKGRINKRKRARTVKLNQGQMSLQSDSARIEYGYANAYTKSGSIGVKLWICYSDYFTKQFKESFLQYVEYSKKKNNNVKT